MQRLRNILEKTLATVWSGVGRFDAHERRLVIQAFVVGAVVWGIVYALKIAVHEGFHAYLHLTEMFPSVWLLLIPLVVGALIVAAIAGINPSFVTYTTEDGVEHELNVVEGDGLERAISLYFTSELAEDNPSDTVDSRWERPTFTTAIKKMAATFFTLISGGSGGLEASVTLIGESVASGIFKPRMEKTPTAFRFVDPVRRWWHSTEAEDLQSAQLCGIAAAVSTLLGAPFTAAFFAIEVMYRRRPIINRLIYALISSMVAFFLSHLVPYGDPLFSNVNFPAPPLYDWKYYGTLFCVALTIAAVGVYFGKLRAWSDQFFHTQFPNIFVRHVVGALITGLIVIATYYLTLTLGIDLEGEGVRGIAELVLGSGEGVMNAAVVGKITFGVAVIALLAKLLATISTITSGGSAGLLFPTIFFGTTIAVAWADVAGFENANVLIGPAMTASLVSIVNVPLASILIIVELFGSDYIVPALFMLIVTSLFTHKNSIYRTQHESYDSDRIFANASVKRVELPRVWKEKTLGELTVRRDYQLNVLGVVHREVDDEGHYYERTSVNPGVDEPLHEADLLVLFGDDVQLEKFEAEIAILEEE